MKTKQKGDIAVGKAIDYFLSNDYEVYLPIGDKSDVDLIVEKDSVLYRVQVKYAGIWTASNKNIASLRVMGGNQSFYTAKKYSKSAFDLLFVYSSTNESYLFPWRELNPPRSTIVVGAPKYRSYKLVS